MSYLYFICDFTIKNYEFFKKHVNKYLIIRGIKRKRNLKSEIYLKENKISRIRNEIFKSIAKENKEENTINLKIYNNYL